MSDIEKSKYKYNTDLSTLSARETYKWLRKTKEWLPKCTEAVSTNRTRWNLTDDQVSQIQGALTELSVRSEQLQKELPAKFTGWFTNSKTEAGCKRKLIEDFQTDLLTVLKPITEYGKPKEQAEASQLDSESMTSSTELLGVFGGYPLSSVPSITTSGSPSTVSTRNAGGSSRGSPVLTRSTIPTFVPPPDLPQVDEDGAFLQAMTTRGNLKVQLFDPRRFRSGESSTGRPNKLDEGSWI